MTDPLKDALDDLDWIVARWPDLRGMVAGGTPRRWKQAFAQLTAEQQEIRDRQAWLDRHDVKGEAIGGGRAPLNVDVLDFLAGVLMRCDMLHDHVAQTVGHPRLDPATGVDDDPRRFLAYVKVLLPEACEADPDMADAAAERLSGIRLSMATELGDLEDGHTLNAICPFCLGRSPRNPVGGARTLRIRMVEVKHRKPEGDEHVIDEPVVVCESGTCTPFAAEVSRWVKGKPAWPWPEWEWLAQRLLDPRSVGVA